MRGQRVMWFVAASVIAACGGPSRGGDDAPDAAGGRDGYHYGQVVVSEQHQGIDTIGNLVVELPEASSQLFGGPTASAGGCDYFGTTGPVFMGQSAGRVDVTGALETLYATPDSSTPPVQYSYFGDDVPDLYAADAALTITAAGDAAGLPAFSGSVQTPRQIGGAVLPQSVSRSAPPTITWVHQDSDEMWFWMATRISGNNFTILWCRGPDNGSFTFPQAALDLIEPTGTTTFVQLWSTNTTTVMAGTLPVDIVASDARVTEEIPFGP